MSNLEGGEEEEGRSPLEQSLFSFSLSFAQSICVPSRGICMQIRLLCLRGGEKYKTAAAE